MSGFRGTSSAATSEHPVIALHGELAAPEGRPDWQSLEWAVGDAVGDIAWESDDDPFLLIARAASALDSAGLADGWQISDLAAARYALREFRYRKESS